MRCDAGVSLFTNAGIDSFVLHKGGTWGSWNKAWVILSSSAFFFFGWQLWWYWVMVSSQPLISFMLVFFFISFFSFAVLSLISLSSRLPSSTLVFFPSSLCIFLPLPCTSYEPSKYWEYAYEPWAGKFYMQFQQKSNVIPQTEHSLGFLSSSKCWQSKC